MMNDDTRRPRWMYAIIDNRSPSIRCSQPNRYTTVQYQPTVDRIGPRSLMPTAGPKGSLFGAHLRPATRVYFQPDPSHGSRWGVLATVSVSIVLRYGTKTCSSFLIYPTIVVAVAETVADTRRRRGTRGGRPSRHFRWGRTLAKHTYVLGIGP